MSASVPPEREGRFFDDQPLAYHLLAKQWQEAQDEFYFFSRQYHLIGLPVVDPDLRQLQTNVWKQDEFDPVDVNLSSKIFFQLHKEELFKVIVTRQIGRKQKKGHTGDKKNGTEDNEKPRSEHSNSVDESGVTLRHLTESLA